MIMLLNLLLLDTFTQATAPAAPQGQPTPTGTLGDPWLLLASVAMLVISFFLLHQAVMFQKWITGKNESAPNPWAGVGLAVGLSLAMI